MDCGADLDAAENPDPAAPHYPIVGAAYLADDIPFQTFLAQFDGATLLPPVTDPNIGGEVGGFCVEGRLCWLNWHRGTLVVSAIVAGGVGIEEANTQAMLLAMIPDVIANLIESGESDTSTATTLPAVPVPPTVPVLTTPVTGAPVTSVSQGAAFALPLTIANPGDPAQTVDLTPEIPVGSSVTYATEQTLEGTFQWSDGSSLAGSAHWVDQQSSQVVASNPDGSYTQRLTIDSVSVDVISGPPEMATTLNTDYFNELLGLPLVLGYDGQNVIVSEEISPDAEASQDLRDRVTTDVTANQMAPNAFPAGQVGVGATWTVVHPFGWAGASGWFVVSYQLDSLVDGAWTISYSYTIDMATIVFDDGSTVTGTIAETGTWAGSASAPLTSVGQSVVTNATTYNNGFTENSTLTKTITATQAA